MFNHQKLKCYEYSMEVAKRLPNLIHGWPRGYAYLEDQLKRAASSIILNIAEGNAKTYPNERRRFFGIARGSAAEVSSIFDVTLALGLIDQKLYDYFQNLLIQTVKILYKLR